MAKTKVIDVVLNEYLNTILPIEETVKLLVDHGLDVEDAVKTVDDLRNDQVRALRYSGWRL